MKIVTTGYFLLNHNAFAMGRYPIEHEGEDLHNLVGCHKQRYADWDSAELDKDQPEKASFCLAELRIAWWAS